MRSAGYKIGVMTVSLASLLCAGLALTSPWATYLQFFPFVTPVTVIVTLMSCYSFFRFLTRPVILVDRASLYLILYVLLITASYFWSLTYEKWANTIFWWFLCIATYFSARSAPRKASDFRLVLFAFFIGMLITFSKLQLSFDEWGNTNDRFSVAEHNTNFTAYVLSGGLFLFLAIWVHLGATRAMWLMFPVWIGVTIYTQILLGTRGAILSSVLTLCVFLLRRFIPNVGLKAIIIVMLLIGLSVSLGLAQHLMPFFDTIFAGRSTGDLSNRGLIWAEAFTYLLSNPFLGIGPGSFAEVSELHAGAHNLLLTISLESGLLGLFLFSGFVFLFLRGVYRKSRTPREGLTLLAMFMCFWLPIVTSGHWELAPFSWLLLAFFERLVSTEGDGKAIRSRVARHSR